MPSLTARPAASRLPVVGSRESSNAARARTASWALAFLLLVDGCTGGTDLLGDGDHEVVPPADADGEADADAVADAGVCVGGWYDSTSGLCWEDPPDPTTRSWDDAVAYCDSLALGGREDWHLPTISELRSLIRGCPATETGGSCGVTDSCTGDGCGSWGSCAGCSYLGGPGAGGSYWPPELTAHDYGWFWSSSSYAGGAFYACYVGFYYGGVYYSVRTGTVYVRCVRSGP
jgi:hypothetical protein